MLTIVPTPLGNLEDMTPRALRALQQSQAVYCEDTRRTRALMSRFNLATPLLRYDERDERGRHLVIERLLAGQNLALVCDGGLPGISDPGWRLVALARQNSVAVTALPGGSAVTTALAGSGLPADSFVFLGFLPRSPGKQKKLLASAAALNKTIVVYESPFRVVGFLATASETLGAGAQCCVARELSKLHEEWLYGTIASVHANLADREEVLGELVVMLNPRAYDKDTNHQG